MIWSRDRPSLAQYDEAAWQGRRVSSEKLFNLGHEAIEFSNLEVAADRPLPELRTDNDDLARSIAVDLIDDTNQRSIAKYQQSGLPRRHLSGASGRATLAI